MRTLISALSFLLKQPKRTLRCPGLRPSTIDGMDRTLSAIENRMSSLLIKSASGTLSMLWSK